MPNAKYNLTNAQFAGGFPETVKGDQLGGVVINTADETIVIPPATLTEANIINGLAKYVLMINQNNGWDVAKPADWVEGNPPSTDKLMRFVALIHSEASEAVEAIRKGDRENFTEELADVIIRCLDAAGGLDLDIGQAIIDKLEKNKQRGYRHGGKLA